MKQIVSVVIGAGLMAAGITSATSEEPPGASPIPHWMVVGIAELELCLGLWLVSGIGTRLAQRVAACFLAANISAAVLLIIMRTNSSSYIGGFPARPWVTVVIDLALLIALFVSTGRLMRTCDNKRRSTTNPRYAAIGSRSAICLGFLVAAGLAAIAPSTDWSSAVLAKLQGAAIIVKPNRVDFGDINERETCNADFAITNISRSPVTVLGARVTCTCVSIKPLPATLQPGESLHARLTLASGAVEEARPLSATATFYLDVPSVGPTLVAAATVQPRE